MLPKTTTKKFLFFAFVLIVSRLIYTAIGVYTRTNLLNTTKPFLSWTYDSPHQALNTWTVWDSGFYYQIATQGYPNNIGSLKKAEIPVPANSWVKVFLGYGEVGDTRIKLPNSSIEKINNTLFIIGSSEFDSQVPIYGAYPGIPYCTYTGPIDFDRDVKPASESLVDSKACVDSVCNKSYVTYYSVLAKDTIFQEYFDVTTPNNTQFVEGDSRPSGFENETYQGFGCDSVSVEQLQNAPQIDYTTKATAYPFLPGYPYLVKMFTPIAQDPVLAGVIISNLALFLSAVFLYKLLETDFDEELAFYSVLFYLVYPLSFILSGFFSEAVFNLLVFSGLYFVRKGNFVLASLLGAYSSVTRIVGFVMLPVLAVVYYKRYSGTKRILAILSLVGFPILMGLHAYYLYTLTGDWLIMFNSQQAFGRVGQGTVSAFVNYLLNSSRAGDFEMLVFLITVLLVGFTLVKIKTVEGLRVPVEHVVYSILLLLIPVSSGILTSFPRYTLSIFPIYLGGAYLAIQLRHERLFLALSFIASCLFMAIWALSSRFIV